MKHAHTAIRKIERLSQFIFISLFVLTILFSCTYIFLVNKTVLNAVAKEKIEHEIASINSDLSEKEFQYISSKGSVTRDLATNMGFVSAEDKTSFVTVFKPNASVAIR